MAGPDGSFVSTGACNLGVPGSNPGRNGNLSSWLYIYTVLQTVRRHGVYNAAFYFNFILSHYIKEYVSPPAA